MRVVVVERSISVRRQWLVVIRWLLLLLFVASSSRRTFYFRTPSTSSISTASAFVPTAITGRRPQQPQHYRLSFRHNTDYDGGFSLSSFYGDFEDFGKDDRDDDEDEDEEDDDDEQDLIDDKAVADFRTRMSSLFSSDDDDDGGNEVDELIRFAVRSDEGRPAEWARAVETVEPGCILLAHPKLFQSPQMLSKFGLTMPPPLELGPDRRADLLPVLMVVSMSNNEEEAVLLNRRTGYLLGDLETPSLEQFCIQPLWFGGVDSSDSMEMLHQCSTVPGCQPLTEDGLYWGGDPARAGQAMEEYEGGGDDGDDDRVLTGFDFKFFVQITKFKTNELQKMVESGVFVAAQLAKEVLFKSRDRMGTRRAKPLWTEVMELLGDDYVSMKEEFYKDSDAAQEEDYS